MGYTNEDVIECRLEDWGKPKEDGTQEQRYKAFFTDGKSKWLRRCTSVLKTDGGKIERLKQWAVNKTLERLYEILPVGAVLTEDLLTEKLEEVRLFHKEKLDEAGQYGTQAHVIIERFLKTGAWPEDSEWSELPAPVQNALQLFTDWWEESKFVRVVEVELYVYDLAWGYGGKLDYLAEDDEGRLHLIDWKTSGGIYEDYPIQVAAYANGLLKARGITIDGAHIVRIGKTDLIPQMLSIPMPLLRKAWSAFTYCSDLLDIQRELQKLTNKSNREHRAKTEELKALLEARANEPELDDQNIPEAWRRFVREVGRVDVKAQAVLADCRAGGWHESSFVIELPNGWEWHWQQIKGNPALAKASEAVFGRLIPISLRGYEHPNSKPETERQSA